jgi:hypothetical protein
MFAVDLPPRFVLVAGGPLRQSSVLVQLNDAHMPTTLNANKANNANKELLHTLAYPLSHLEPQILTTYSELACPLSDHLSPPLRILSPTVAFKTKIYKQWPSHPHARLHAHRNMPKQPRHVTAGIPISLDLLSRPTAQVLSVSRDNPLPSHRGMPQEQPAVPTGRGHGQIQIAYLWRHPTQYPRTHGPTCLRREIPFYDQIAPVPHLW